MEFTIKKRALLFIKFFIIFLVINFLGQYFFKHSDMNFYTIISVALGGSIGISFSDKFVKRKNK